MNSTPLPNPDIEAKFLPMQRWFPELAIYPDRDLDKLMEVLKEIEFGVLKPVAPEPVSDPNQLLLDLGHVVVASDFDVVVSRAFEIEDKRQTHDN